MNAISQKTIDTTKSVTLSILVGILFFGFVAVAVVTLTHPTFAVCNAANTKAEVFYVNDTNSVTRTNYTLCTNLTYQTGMDTNFRYGTMCNSAGVKMPYFFPNNESGLWGYLCWNQTSITSGQNQLAYYEYSNTSATDKPNNWYEITPTYINCKDGDINQTAFTNASVTFSSGICSLSGTNAQITSKYQWPDNSTIFGEFNISAYDTVLAFCTNPNCAAPSVYNVLANDNNEYMRQWVSGSESVTIGTGFKNIFTLRDISRLAGSNQANATIMWSNGTKLIYSTGSATQHPTGNLNITFITSTATGKAQVKWFIGKRKFTPEPSITRVESISLITNLLDWLNQTPSDLTSTNGFNGLNISYNLTNSSGVGNLSLEYLANGTRSATNNIWINGSQLGTLTVTGTNSSYSGYWNFSLGDNFYPYTSNLNISDFTTLSVANLTANNDWHKVRLFNVSSSLAYGFFEFNARNATTAGNPLNIWYCNSTYSSGNPTTSPNCVQFAQINSTDAFNHTHNGGPSSHFVRPFTISSGLINGIKVTSTSYFLFKGTTGNNWGIYYSTTVSQTDTTQTSGSGGAAWSDLAGTTDAHLHQFGSTDKLYYRAVANYANGTTVASAWTSDNLDLDPLNPTAVSFFNPADLTEIVGDEPSFNISWSESVPQNGIITQYNLTILYGANLSLANNIIANNNATFYYIPNLTAYDGGHYHFRVCTDTSLGGQTCTLSPEVWFYRARPVNYATPVSAGQSTLINATAPVFNDSVTGNFTLNYNGTAYQATTASGLVLTNTVTAPTPSGDSHSVTFNYSGYFILSNGTNVSYSGLSRLQTVNKVSLYICNGTYPTTALNVSFYNEETGTYGLSGTLEWNGTISSGYAITGMNGSQVNTSVLFCITPATATATANVTFRFYNATSATRGYYLINAPLSSSVNNVSLFLKEAGDVLNVTVTVLENGVSVPAIVQFQRYFVPLNAYRLVEMAETSSQAGGVAKLRYYDTWYRVVIFKDGVEVTSFSPITITGNALTFDITSGQTGQYWTYYQSVTSSCTATAETGVIACTFADSSGLSSQSSFLVTERGPLTSTTECSETSTSAGYTYICNVGNTTGREFDYKVSAIVSGGEVVINSGSMSGLQTSEYSTTGTFLSILIVIGVASIGVFNPAAMILLAFAGVVVSTYAGMSLVTSGGLMGLGVVVGLLIYKVKT